MNLRTHIRTMALGSMLALAVAGVPAVHAHAEPNNGNGDGIEMDCPLSGNWVASGGYVIAKDANGVYHRVFCEDGEWIDTGPIVGYIVSPPSGGTGPVTANPGRAAPASAASIP